MSPHLLVEEECWPRGIGGPVAYCLHGPQHPLLKLGATTLPLSLSPFLLLLLLLLPLPPSLLWQALFTFKRKFRTFEMYFTDMNNLILVSCKKKSEI